MKYAIVFGVVGAVVCRFLRNVFNTYILPEDEQSIFAVHAGGGATGMLLTAFFAKYVCRMTPNSDEKLTADLAATQPLVSMDTVD